MVTALAWLVLIFVAVFIVLPLLGAVFQSSDAAYWDCLKLGLAIVNVLIIFALVLGAVLWALKVVING